MAGDGLAEFVGRLGGRRETDHLTAARSPGVREDAHRGGLACPGGSEGELDDGSRGCEVADHRGLGVVELEALGCGGSDGDLDPYVGQRVGAGSCGEREEFLLGAEDLRRRVERGAVDVVDARAVGATELGRFRDGVVDAEPDGAGDRGLDDLADGLIHFLTSDPGPACLALGFGEEVPDVPGRSGFLDGSRRSRRRRPRPTHA